MRGYLSSSPTGDLTSNSGMCPAWELNWWPFGSQSHTQSTELHQPGLILSSLKGIDLDIQCNTIVKNKHSQSI